MRNFALANYRLLDTADCDLVRDGGYLNLQLQTDVAVWVNTRSNLDVDTDIDVLELRVDKRIHETGASSRTPADSGLEAAGCHGDAVADIQLCRLPFQGTNLRVLNNPCGGISQQEVRGGAGEGENQVILSQVRELIQRDCTRSRVIGIVGPVVIVVGRRIGIDGDAG